MRKVFLSAALTGAVCFAGDLADIAARGDMAAVRASLAQKQDVNAPQVDGTTALHWAANFDDADLVKALLAAGANPRVSNRYGITPLSQACENGNAQIVEMLIKAGADVNAPHAEGETPLMTASRTGNPAAIKVLLDNGADIHAAEQWRGHTEAVKLLISRGAKMDVRSKEFDFTALRPKAGSVGMNFPRGGFTPLLFAARQGHFDTVKALVEGGANIDLPEPDGTTALVMAIINFHYDIASYLMDKGADVNAADIRGRSALYSAVDQKNLDISNRPPAKVDDKNNPETLMRQLIAKGANPNAGLIKSLAPRAVLDGGDGTMGAGATPFLRAVRAGDVETMKFLLANGANLNATTAAGANAMLIAAGMGWRDGKTNAPEANSVAAIQYLASLGMSVNSVATSGETPMHSAGGRGSDLVVETLAKLGGDVNAKDKQGRTPYDIATGAGAGIGGVRTPQESTMALLVKLGGGPAEKLTK